MLDTMTAGTGRIGRRDVAIAGLFSVLGMLLMYVNVQDEKVAASAFAIPAFLAVTAPLLWRRAAPVAATGAVLAALVAHQLVFGADVIRCGVMLPTAFLLGFTCAAQLERREALAGLGLALGIVLAESVAFLGPFGAFVGLVTVAIWGIGRIVRSRGRMTVELRARTAELREARDERARLEVATDRARLSGELDRLLQRRLGELARMADEGATPADAATATAALVDIERESRRTLEEMRAVVGVLRDDGSNAPTAPQPTLTSLEALLVRASGVGARLTVDGSPRVLPPGVELSAYRIVEHLLDGLEDQHEVDVAVSFRDDALELRVSGRARRGAKAALARASDRVRLQHGTVVTTTRAGRAEAVVSLPVAAGA